MGGFRACASVFCGGRRGGAGTLLGLGSSSGAVISLTRSLTRRETTACIASAWMRRASRSGCAASDLGVLSSAGSSFVAPLPFELVCRRFAFSLRRLALQLLRIALAVSLVMTPRIAWSAVVARSRRVVSSEAPNMMRPAAHARGNCCHIVASLHSGWDSAAAVHSARDAPPCRVAAAVSCPRSSCRKAMCRWLSVRRVSSSSMLRRPCILIATRSGWVHATCAWTSLPLQPESQNGHALVSSSSMSFCAGSSVAGAGSADAALAPVGGGRVWWKHLARYSVLT